MRLTCEVPPLRGALGIGTAFGTFGELLQGALPVRDGSSGGSFDGDPYGDPDGDCDGDFLVTLPVARWTRATFRPGPGGPAEVTVRPAHKTKALRLARMIVEESGFRGGGVLTVDSVIPEGKGLASSSADLVATARAVGRALGTPMPPRRIERLLTHIEPTDGVLYPAIVAYHHRTVRLRAVLGSLPAMAVVGVDEGGSVDTVAFNRVPKSYTAARRREYAALLDRLAAAVPRHDLAEVGRVATRSALLNQSLRYKPWLDPMREICREVGGVGVAVGHSGTTLGILLDTRDPSYTRRAMAAAQACGELACGEPACAGRPDAVSVYRTLSFADVPSPGGGSVGDGDGYAPAVPQPRVPLEV